jgi:hypothetical protein
MVQRHYDFLKNLAQLYLPGLATLYFTLSQIWGIPFGPEVVGSITAVDTFLGVILKVSTSKYRPPTDGNVYVDTSDPEIGKYRLEIKEDSLEQIADKDQIRLQVKPELQA